MDKVHLKRITGHASHGNVGYRQINAASGAKTEHFYAFMPINGDATLTTLKDIVGTDVTAYNGVGTYRQNVLYTGSFGAITVATGEVIYYLSEQ